jgi:hypothetical protein
LFLISEEQPDGWSMFVAPDDQRDVAELRDRTFALRNENVDALSVSQQFAPGRLTLDVSGVVVFEDDLCEALRSAQDCAADWDQHADRWDIACVPSV